MTPTELKDALLRSKALDVPPSGAKARAIDAIQNAVLAGTATTAAAATTVTAMSWLRVAAIVAVSAGAGAGGEAIAERAMHPSTAPSPAIHVTADAPASATGPADRGTSSTPNAPAAATVAVTADANVGPTCGGLALPDGPPRVCSPHTGKRVAIELKNTCSDATVDVYWVDFECHEVFRGRLPPGKAFRQLTSDTHPWRLRDHATGKLLKEVTAPSIDTADTEATPVLPEVVVKRGDALPDTPPATCSHYSARPRTKLHVVNQRDTPVSVMWIDYDCGEKFMRQLDAHETFDFSTNDGDGWRVRDARTAEVLEDFLPPTPDTTVYLSVP